MALGNTYNMTIDQGATFELRVTWKDPDGVPINLSGYTARMQIRDTYSSATPLVSITSGSGITLGGTAGTVDLLIPAETTSALNAPLSGVYDLEIVNGGTVVTRLIQGTVTITAEVTR
jgi:hypothetical protein